REIVGREYGRIDGPSLARLLVPPGLLLVLDRLPVGRPPGLEMDQVDLVDAGQLAEKVEADAVGIVVGRSGALDQRGDGRLAELEQRDGGILRVGADRLEEHRSGRLVADRSQLADRLGLDSRATVAGEHFLELRNRQSMEPAKD